MYWAIDNYQVKPIKRVFLEKDLFPLTELEFEGELYNVPNNYIKFLTMRYEDFYTIPSDIGVQKHIKKMAPFMDDIKKFVENND